MAIKTHETFFYKALRYRFVDSSFLACGHWSFPDSSKYLWQFLYSCRYRPVRSTAARWNGLVRAMTPLGGGWPKSTLTPSVMQRSAVVRSSVWGVLFSSPVASLFGAAVGRLGGAFASSFRHGVQWARAARAGPWRAWATADRRSSKAWRRICSSASGAARSRRRKSKCLYFFDNLKSPKKPHAPHGLRSLCAGACALLPRLLLGRDGGERGRKPGLDLGTLLDLRCVPPAPQHFARLCHLSQAAS